jgi:uncharacterized membrane protein
MKVAGTLVPIINVENVMKLGLYWNTSILYITITAVLTHYYVYSTLFISIFLKLAYSIASYTEMWN